MKPEKPEKTSSLAPLMAVGTFVVDYHKVLDHYPKERTSTRVLREEVSNGGAPLNTLINLAKLQVDFPLCAAAKVGQDLDGRLIVEYCQKHGINISQVIAVEGSSTGYTDVYTVESTGRHTCFHYSGIGDTFSRRDVKLRAVNPKILFLGSLGALGKMDNYNPDFGRRGATQLVRDARKQNITTVVEIAPTDRTTKIEDYVETLEQSDYLLISDRLAEELMGIELYSQGQFDPELAREAAQELLNKGLRKAVVLHAGTAAICLQKDGSFTHQSGYLLPTHQRRGSAGVDHAFGAGFLEGLYHEKPMANCLEQGLAVATRCRCHLTPSEAIVPLKECMKFHQALSPKIIQPTA